jgi:hypothetical protein
MGWVLFAFATCMLLCVCVRAAGESAKGKQALHSCTQTQTCEVSEVWREDAPSQSVRYFVHNMHNTPRTKGVGLNDLNKIPSTLDVKLMKMRKKQSQPTNQQTITILNTARAKIRRSRPTGQPGRQATGDRAGDWRQTTRRRIKNTV